MPKRYLACLIGMVLILPVGHVLADKQPSLEQLRNDIEQLKGEIEANKKKQTDYLAQLRRHDLRIAKLARLVHRIDEQLAKNKSQITHLHHQQQDLSRQSSHHRHQLAKILNQMYRAGNQDLLRILLSIDEAGKVQRQLSYYSYFSRARVQQLSEAQETQKILRRNQISLEQKQQQLASLQADRQAELVNLRKAKAGRGEFLSQINRTISNQESQLNDLRENLRNLQNLITDLDEPDIASEPKLAFASLKGDLAWPVAGGAIIENFGGTRSGVKRQGVLIAASEEQPVYPVAGGKVLYADWLRGFGMLLIIDHGGHYMSLYGHNNALFCDKGDWVTPRQQIASVGNSGNGDKIGLYFELRFKGKPINPKRWFKH